MYSKFFGFKEKPFILAPNPAYLFLGKSHEEAQAHLVYAVSEGEGFISLIGERGVGKTTICQAFIERRDDNIEVAYIFKPELRPEELLRKIISEFGIEADTDDAKDLIDTLNSFLMQKRVEGKKVVLFIDDAHNLKADSLEQVRLLSNLETTRDKLLQIVLVGEPSLADMLGSQALRQLGQRVSVSYYIDPLTYEETCAYIYHRMSIASLGAQTHFEASALKRIYRFSGGIPRLINIACDKSLFTAHRHKHSYISEKIAKTAIMDLAGRSGRRRFGFLNRRRYVLAGAGCCLLLLMIAVFFPRQADRQTVALQTEAKPAAVKQPAKPKANPLPANTANPDEKVHQANVPEANGPAVKAAVMQAARPAPEKVLPPPVKMTHSVQVGAFRNRKLSEKLVGTLKGKGYRAGIVPVTDSKARTWYTVRIGDHPSRDAALQQADAFTSREKMESAVRPFEKL